VLMRNSRSERSYITSGEKQRADGYVGDHVSAITF
jgi:hypothetical protein